MKVEDLISELMKCDPTSEVFVHLENGLEVFHEGGIKSIIYDISNCGDIVILYQEE